MDVIYLNEFKNNFDLYTKVENVLFDDMNVLLYCTDTLFMDCYLEVNLKRLLNITDRDEKVKRTVQQTYNNVPFHHNNYFIEFDLMVCISMFDETMAYLDHIASNKGIMNRKMVLLIKNLQMLSKTQQNVFSRLVEKIQRSYMLIVTTQKLSKIINSLKSRMLCYNLNHYSFSDVLQKYIEDQHLDNSVLKDILKSDHVTLKSALLSLHTGVYRNFVEDEILGLVSQVKKIKVIGNYIDRIREVVYMLLIYNISHTDICKAIMSSVMNKFSKNKELIQSMVNVVATTEHNILLSSKPLYHFEQCLLCLYKLVHTKK